MSLKCTILALEGAHVFWTCLDDDNIYIEIENPDSFELYKRYNKIPTGVMSIPGKILNKIIENGKLKSWSGEDFDHPKTQEERNKEFQEGIEQTIEMLEAMNKQKKRLKTLKEHMDSLPKKRQLKIQERAEELKKEDV